MLKLFQPHSNYEAMEKAYTEVHAKLERIAKLRMLSSRPSSGAGNVTRTSSMVSLRTSSYMPVETWKMPFQFKCIGTLRWALLYDIVCSIRTRYPIDLTPRLSLGSNPFLKLLCQVLVPI